MLTASFVSDCALDFDEEGLAYIAVHCHGGANTVGFSPDDLASHQRGYPALLEILGDKPVGGLVFARQAAAGDIWTPSGSRTELSHIDIIGIPHQRLYPEPKPHPNGVDARYDRQARLFGDRGQAILDQQKVAVIGAGGGGSLIIEQLSRLGVGEIVVVDPDRLDPSNLPRVVGSIKRDLRPVLTDKRVPRWLQSYGRRHRTLKIRIAERVARAANPSIAFHGIARNVIDLDVASELVDCDYIFLAADTMQARLLFNAVIHQYLIPGVQVGAKAQVDQENGEIIDVFSVSRQVLPGQGCLWCNGLISPSKLQEEATDPDQLKRQRYVDDDDVPSPSVITLNALGVAHATNEYLFNQLGLQDSKDLRWPMFYPREGQVAYDLPRHTPGCHECDRRLGAGPLIRLPTRT
jgi:tRNA A37 threonylcarbamoyladenosine dehydratase